MIVGKKVSLRALEEADLPALRDWRNRQDFRQYFREYRELGMENQHKWFESLVVPARDTLMFGIVDSKSGELLGCCGLCYVNWVQRFADLSLYVGKDGAYIDSHGYAQEACTLLFDYAFGELGLHKIWTEIYEFDKPKQSLYLGLGFQQDGLLRDNYYHNGRWWNSRIMSLLVGDWYGLINEDSVKA